MSLENSIPSRFRWASPQPRFGGAFSCQSAGADQGDAAHRDHKRSGGKEQALVQANPPQAANAIHHEAGPKGDTDDPRQHLSAPLLFWARASRAWQLGEDGGACERASMAPLRLLRRRKSGRRRSDILETASPA